MNHGFSVKWGAGPENGYYALMIEQYHMMYRHGIHLKINWDGSYSVYRVSATSDHVFKPSKELGPTIETNAEGNIMRY